MCFHPPRSLAALLILLLAFSVMTWGTQLRQIGIIDIPGQPGFEQAIFVNGMLVLSHSAGNALEVFDPVRRRVVKQVQGMAGPHGLVADVRSGKLFVANSQGANIAVVSSKDWRVERTIQLKSGPYNLALSPDASRLFVANWRSRSVSAIALNNGDEVKTADVAGSPQSLVFDSARNVVFATLQDTAEVIALDPSDLKVLARYKITASQPTAMILDPAVRRLYVAVRHAVVTLDAETGTEVGRVAAPPGVDSLWLDQAAGALYVASGGGYINVYRTRGGLTPLQEIRTEVRGHTVAFDPSRNVVYVPGGREGRSKLLILRQLPLSDPDDRGEQVANK